MCTLWDGPFRANGTCSASAHVANRSFCLFPLRRSEIGLKPYIGASPWKLSIRDFPRFNLFDFNNHQWSSMMLFDHLAWLLVFKFDPGTSAWRGKPIHFVWMNFRHYTFWLRKINYYDENSVKQSVYWFAPRHQIFNYLQWSSVSFEWSSMIFNEFQWSSMIFNDLQWSSMIFNDLQWYSMIFNDLQWSSVSFEWSSMIFNEFQWSSMIFNDLQWSSMIFNDLQWCSMIFNDLQWSSIIFNDLH